MSRCFPFPPPGYDKKARADEENLLNKEKQKEKKHKKEKKDREKREGKEKKEKKEKERSEEKHKEKKERKKDKHKDKERNSVSVENDTARPPEHGIAEKLGPSPVQSAQSSDAKFLLELGKRIGNNDVQSAEKNLLVHKFTLTSQGNIEKPGKDKGEDQTKVNGRQNGVVAANGFIQKFEGVHRRTAEGVGGVLEKSVQKRMEQEEDNKQNNGKSRGGEQKESDPRKKIGVGGLVEKSIEKRMQQEEYNKQNNGESKGGEQKDRDPGKKVGVGVLAEKPIEKQTEQEEKKKQKNGESRAGKHKDRDPERKSKSKDKKRDKEKEKEERKERKKEKKREKELKKEQLKQRESGEPAADGANMRTASDILKERSGGEGKVGKRKELETNGFLHDTDTGVRPSKLLRPLSSTLHVVENGRMAPVSGNGRMLEQSPTQVSTHQVMENGIRFVDVQGNKKISSSPAPSVPGNGRIPEPSPRSASSTHQIIVNGRKPEHSKTAIRIVAEYGEGSKKVTSSLSVAGNGKIVEQYPRPKIVVSTEKIEENGRKPEYGKAAVRVVSEAEGNSNKFLSSISVAETGSKMEPPTPALPAPENGRRLELCRSNDQSASCGNVLIINHKVGPKEIRVNGKEEGQQSSISLKRPSPSSVQDQLASGRNKEEGQQPSISLNRPSPSSIHDQSASGRNVVVINPTVDNKEIRVNGKEVVAQQPNVSLKRPSSSSKQVKEKVIKPKPPHPDSKFLDSIYSVPQVELSDFDEQEWLFGSSSDFQQAKRPRVGSSQVEGTTKQVWAEALRLESADIVALPYVIRY